MRRVDWYFDFVSPFSYLQSRRLGELPDHVAVTYRPVLFAALLQHWGTRGPGELGPKRRFTYRYLAWYARRHRIPFRMPPAHPFNPLPLLRLALVLDCAPEAVDRMFEFVWVEGRLPDDARAWQGLAEALGVPDADGRIAAPEVKAALRSGTEEAIRRGIFGVPTLAIDGELFWGVDATPMAVDYLREPEGFETEEMRRVSELPVGAERG